MTGIAALVGPAALSGAVLVVRGRPRRHRPTLEQRLAPYLRTAPEPDRSVAARVLGPALRDLAAHADRVLGGRASVARRLAAAGSDVTVDRFRAEQVLGGAVGAGVGILVVLVRVAGGAGPSPIAGLAITVVLALAGVLVRDHRLSRAVTRRQMRIAAELPVVAELTALAVAAGDPPAVALGRVAAAVPGALSDEIRRTLAATRDGATFVAALRDVASRTGVPGVTRFVDGITVALERGTPLAAVLRAQAVDAREAGRRSLIEAGARKEVQMLVPVVFLVLPTVVVFALYPSVVGLSTLTP
ncbi:MAG TPA: type II secretion system F family protein [Mycobacteriales bacterium]|nr:type II secretion system F family protein [Mycobacteriales bacterium]